MELLTPYLQQLINAEKQMAKLLEEIRNDPRYVGEIHDEIQLKE